MSVVYRARAKTSKESLDLVCELHFAMWSSLFTHSQRALTRQTTTSAAIVKLIHSLVIGIFFILIKMLWAKGILFHQGLALELASSAVHGPLDSESCLVHSTDQNCALDSLNSYTFTFCSSSSIAICFSLAFAIHSHLKSLKLCNIASVSFTLLCVPHCFYLGVILKFYLTWNVDFSEWIIMG